MSRKRTTVRFFLVVVATLSTIAGGVAHAQPAPMGDHHASRGADSGYGAGQVSPTGGYNAAIPIAAPPVRGGVPIPFTVAYNGGNRVGEAGLGWSIPFSYVIKTSSLSGRRPMHHIDWKAPVGRERVTLTLNGSTAPMLRDNSGTYRAIVNAPNLRLTEHSDHWLLEDGSGMRYRFETIPALGDNEMWLLREINDASGENPVGFEYEVNDVKVDGVVHKELALAAIHYNEHPTSPNCFKHKIYLYYGAHNPDAKVLNYMVARGKMTVRTQVVERIDVMARSGGCAGSFEALRRYTLSYSPDTDTQQPRLTSVHMTGRQETPEADTTLPVARYEYGAITNNGVVSFAQAGATATPSVGMATRDGVSRGHRFETPESTTYSTQQFLHDFTGDGLPDLVFSSALNPAVGELRISRATSSGQTFVPPALEQVTTPLFPAGDSDLILGEQKSKKNIGGITTNITLYNKMGQDQTFSQLIDFNADGRTDILRANNNGNWTLYVNTPDATDPATIDWKSVELDMTKIREQLTTNGLFASGRLPLSQAKTGLDQDVQVCWTSDGASWIPCADGYGQLLDNKKEWVSRTEWKLSDVNGDGYPDLVANSAAIGLHLLSKSNNEPWCDGDFMKPEWDAAYHANDWQVRCRIKNRVGFAPNATNKLMVFYNRAGTKFGVSATPFAVGQHLVGADGHPVEEWATTLVKDSPTRWVIDAPTPPKTGTRRFLRYGLLELNGDGILDRVMELKAKLGTGVGFSNRIWLPGSAALVESTYDAHCSDDPDADVDPKLDPVADGHFYTRRMNGVVDVNGDGLPDFVTEFPRTSAPQPDDDPNQQVRVRLGTGIGWAPPVSVSSPVHLARSRTDELCDAATAGTGLSTVSSGMFDFDGDGRADIVSADAGALSVTRVVGSDGIIGAHNAGRLVKVKNGYGAATEIRYTSGKLDTHTDHRVAFAEIVVASVQPQVEPNSTTASSLEPTYFAYGGAKLRFDATVDRWMFAGYHRRVALRGLPDGGQSGQFRLRGVAVIQTMVDSAVLPKFKAYALAGRRSRVDFLDGIFTIDPRDLLAVDLSNDNRRHANQSATYWTRASTVGGGGPLSDCTDIHPYQFTFAFPQQDGTYDRACHKYGFAYQNVAIGWRGDAAPGSAQPNKNIRTQTNVEADGDGRPVAIHRFNDLYVDGDDVCEDITYATSATGHMLAAVHTRRLRACTKDGDYGDGPIIAGVRYRYDYLPEGQVSLGRPTHRIVERYDVSAGTKIEEYVASYSTYDNVGNITQVSRENQTPMVGGATISDPPAMVALSRTEVWSGFDAFRLAPATHTLSATSEDATVSHVNLVTTVTLDPVTLVATSVTDANGTSWSTARDGFSRATRYSVQGAGQTTQYVLGSTHYSGFEADATEPRQVRSVRFNAALTSGDFDPGGNSSTAQTVTTARMDEYGRVRTTETGLGQDYANERMISGETVFDGLGRPVFVADPYPSGEAENVHYGTSMTYRDDGSAECSIRGRGPQIIATSNSTLARYASCVERIYDNHRLTVRARGANELMAGSGQHGAYTEQIQTAIGWVVEKSRWHEGTVELSEQQFDRLGNLTKLTRYESPQDRTGPVVWRSELDSLGQMLVLNEAPALPRTNRYDRWGNLYETRSGAGATAKRVVSQVDGYGRRVRSISAVGTSADKDSLTEIFYDQGSGHENHVGANYLVGRSSHTRSFGRRTYFGYDAYGRQNAVTRAEGAERYTQELTYAVTGHLRALTFTLPDTNYQPEVVHYSYDSAMRMVGVAYEDANGAQDLFTAEQVDVFGRHRRVVYGNGVAQEHTYRANDRRELQISVMGEPSNWLRLTIYERYDAQLRLLQRFDYSTVGGVPKSEATRYSFDSLYRLVGAETDQLGNVTQHRAFGYDGLGNLRQVLDAVANTTLTITPATDDRDRICSVRKTSGLADPFEISSVATTDFTRTLTNTGRLDKPCGYRYDGRGNAIKTADSSTTRSLTYDHRSRVATMQTGGISASYRYDALGDVAGLKIDGGTVEQNRDDLWLGSLLERRVVVDGLSTRYEVKRTIPGPSGALAVRGPSANSVVYFHGDGQANRVFTDASGEVVQSVEYSPFGSLLSDTGSEGSATYSKYLWNGGDTIKAFGLTHLGARLYDPTTGRFLQRDPLLIPRSSSRAHPYAFAHSDPINLSDPSGLDPCSGVAADICISNGGGGGLGEPNGAVGALGAWAAGWLIDWVFGGGGGDATSAPNPGVWVQGHWFPTVAAYHAAVDQTANSLRQYLSSLMVDGGLTGYDQEIGTRVVGGLKVVGGFLGTKAGVALCATGAGCVVGGPLIAASADVAASGIRQARTGSHAQTLIGKYGGRRAQAIEEALVFGAGAAYMIAEYAAPVLVARAGASAGAGIPNASKSGTVWDDIVSTQPNYKGSVIPRSFELKTPGGQKVWVHGNATEHMAEFAKMKAQNYLPESVRLASQQQLRSLQAAVDTVTKNGIQYGKMMKVSGWELKFAAPREAGQLPALIHALAK